MNGKCGECAFYKGSDSEGTLGECRYNPPDTSGYWPKVYSREWCGKFQARGGGTVHITEMTVVAD